MISGDLLQLPSPINLIGAPLKHAGRSQHFAAPEQNRTRITSQEAIDTVSLTLGSRFRRRCRRRGPTGGSVTRFRHSSPHRPAVHPVPVIADPPDAAPPAPAPLRPDTGSPNGIRSR